MSRIFIVYGIGFGDEGKGTVTDALARSCGASLVVRYNGGPQAGHNVVAPDGTWHCFAQFGSGTLVPGCRTLLSRLMLIEPENLLVENAALVSKGCGDALERLTIDAGCQVITPFHKMLCQMREIGRGQDRLGSCGMGVGEAVKDGLAGQMLTAGDLLNAAALEGKLAALRKIKMMVAQELLRRQPTAEMRQAYEYFVGRTEPASLAKVYRDFADAAGASLDRSGRCLAEALAEGRTVILEGAQGALLDRRVGFTPYVTKSRSTFHNAEMVLGERAVGPSAANRGIIRIGVMRAYGHRHGPGPFVTEEPNLFGRLSDPYNGENRWQGAFRVGWPDLVALRYGLLINDGADGIALTGLDRLSGVGTIRVCTAYDYEGDKRKLDVYFQCQHLGVRRARITAIKKPANSSMPEGELASLLLNCRPSGWVELPGWSEDISGIRRYEELPAQARGYVDFLQSQLKTPIRLVSVSPRADGKLFIG
jgi:adenylosuccinate synthase